MSNIDWLSDWDGCEVGYNDIPVVSLYKLNNYYLYIDVESGKILEKWSDNID